MSNKTKMVAADAFTFDHRPMGRRTGSIRPVGDYEFEMVSAVESDDYEIVLVDDEPA